jgi:hypothetical protein
VSPSGSPKRGRPAEAAKAPATAAPRRRTRRSGKILYSLIGLMLLTGLLPLLMTAVWLVRRNREALEASERLLQLDQTRSIAQQARLYLQSMHNQLEAIAKTFEIGANPQAVHSRILSVTPEALLDFIEEDRVRAITVFDREGRFVTAGYTLDDAAIEASLRESLVQGLQAKSWTSPAHVSEPLLDTVVIMSEPVRGFYGGEGAPPIEGVVAAMVSLKPIEEMVKQKGNDRRTVYVVDDRGKLVTHSDP